MSVRVRVLILVLCVVLSCLAAAAWAMVSIYVREKATSERALRETARALALVVDSELGRREAIAWTLATSPSVRSGDLQAFHDQALQATAGMSGWVVLFGPQGMLVNTSMPKGAELPRRREGQQRTVQLGGTGATISDLFRGPASQTWVVAVSVPVTQDGVAGHGVSVTLAAEDMQRVIDDQKLAPGWTAAIVDRKGTIVARQPNPQKWIGHAVTADLADRLSTGSEGFMRSRTLDGATVTAFFSKSPNSQWAFVIGVPDTVLGASATRSMTEAGAAAAALLALAVAAAIVVGRRIAVPASRLQRAAEALKAGAPIAYEPSGIAEFDIAGATLAEAGTKLIEANHTIQGRELERDAMVRRLQSQLTRMDMLHQITRAIGERLDLDSVFQVVCDSVERRLEVACCAIALYDATRQRYQIVRWGKRGRTFGAAHELAERSGLDDVPDGLTGCRQGQLAYLSDLGRAELPLARRLADAGLRSAVVAPLQVDGEPFGLLVAARDTADGFSSGDCEFLLQLSEHVALAAHHAQLHGALRQAYDDLNKTQQAVMQQERLRALGQMASGIAHDINNAISPIALYTESLLEQEHGLSARARGYLEIVARAIDDVAATVARLREFYRQRPQQTPLVRLALNPLVMQVAELTRARWSDMPQQRGVVIHLHLALADDLPDALGVEGEIREALINLVFNAVDAMNEGGDLTLRTCAVDGAPRRARVEVIDTGVGMDDETRRRCLEPFFTTKGDRGTGLGLAMVYGTAQRHGAEVTVQSAPGRGTAVALTFAAPRAPDPERESSEADAGPTQPLRLLVVDDDPLVLESLDHMLRGDGHVVVTADGGAAGIDIFAAAQSRDEPFSAVLTDLGMPHVDGRKVAHFVKQSSPGTAVIMLTGWGQDPGPDGDAMRHVDEILGKPPKLGELRRALLRHTRRVRPDTAT